MDRRQYARRRLRSQTATILVLIVGWLVMSALTAIFHGNFVVFLVGALVYFLAVSALLRALSRRFDLW